MIMPDGSDTPTQLREAVTKLLHERESPPWMDHWDDLEPYEREQSNWWLIADAVLDLIRTHVETAILACAPYNMELRPDGTEDALAAAYVEGIATAHSAVLDVLATPGGDA